MDSVESVIKKNNIELIQKKEWRDSPTVRSYTDFSKLDLSGIKIDDEVAFSGKKVVNSKYTDIFASEHDPLLELNRRIQNLNFSVDVNNEEKITFSENESLIGSMQINMSGNPRLELDLGKYKLACLIISISCTKDSKCELHVSSSNSGITYLRFKKEIGQNARLDLVNSHIKDSFLFLSSDCDLKDESQLESRIYAHSDGSAHYDCVQNVNHGLGSKSKVIGRGVINGASSLIFRGMLKIYNERCSGDFSTKTLNISEGDAFTDSVPMLDISAKNVIAKHSSAIENIDDDKIFYLESRGFSKSEGRKLIIDSFLNQGY